MIKGNSAIEFTFKGRQNWKDKGTEGTWLNNMKRCGGLWRPSVSIQVWAARWNGQRVSPRIDGVRSIRAGAGLVGSSHPRVWGGASPLGFHQEPWSAAGPDGASAPRNHASQLPGPPPWRVSERLRASHQSAAVLGGGREAPGLCGGPARRLEMDFPWGGSVCILQGPLPQ